MRGFVKILRVIGRYLIETKGKYYSDNLKHRKYLNYLINSEKKNKKNNSYILFNPFRDVSSKLDSIFIQELINCKEAFDNKIHMVIPFTGLPHIYHLRKHKTLIYLGIYTCYVSYSLLKSCLYNSLVMKKIVELKEKRESLQNIYKVLDRKFKGSSHSIGYQPQ
ncbi:hypothetical protein MKS88_004725 [Plasmodium brasilianum]|uniref:Uncharacterized protein n=1 Tax=Plasmodium brasilianum TaxID=5824 RepID=A0ACB9Y3N0_PLABR|nr:hypothetical protein MKS88_004725 [Plasmodium brasilianum]